MDATNERNDVRDIPEQEPTRLTTEQMLELLGNQGGTEDAYRITETYEHVERVYNAALNIGTFSAAAASTNPR
ncbi:MAG TPA: hypothetical protein VE985_00010 [Gaiellaceae bacterium]|nr:hypothetical protein [Gaiellaceae bacterium]